jgi:uncharacterized protein (DUF2384 family)
MPVLDEHERAALVEADHELSEFQRALEMAAQNDALDIDVIARLKGTAEDAAQRLNAQLPPHIDPDARDEIRRRLIDMLTSRPESDDGLLRLADKILLEAEAVRHVMRDLLDEQPPVALREADKVIALLEEWLPDLTIKQLAELCGISDRQLQRRRQDGGQSGYRLQIVARLVAILRHAWSDQGVYAWFHREHPSLGGRKPIDLIDEPDHERALLLTARSGRVQGGE